MSENLIRNLKLMKSNTRGKEDLDLTHVVICQAINEIEHLTTEVRKLKLQQRIHVSTIKDLQCGALNYLAYPYDAEKTGLDSAIKTSLCIVPLEDEWCASQEKS